MQETSGPHFWQLIAWQVAAFGLLLSAIQFVFNLIRERRERRQQLAKFSYELLDELFDHPTAGPLLVSLDAGFTKGPSAKKRVPRDQRLARDFAEAFGEGYGKEEDRLIAARMQFDSVLYYLNRYEHSIRAGLTGFEDLRDPLRYIVGLLRRFHDNIEDYAEYIGCTDARKFLLRFDEWR